MFIGWVGGAAMGSEGLAVSVTNLTPTFWSVVVLTVVTIGALIKVWPLLDRQKREGDASLRSDLLTRINVLENEIRDERRRCDEEMGKLRAQIDGLQRMIVQFQVSSGQPLRFGSEAEKSVARVAEHLANREGGE